MMLRFFILSVGFLCVSGYFTLPGKCPNNVPSLDDFRLEDFLGTWHQAYYYSSDGQRKNNCSKVEVTSKHGAVSFNVSRIDLGLFHRYSVAQVLPPKAEGQKNLLGLEFKFENDARRLRSRKYDVYVLATNYNYYATLYTCQYSPLIDKHFVYIWVLSRRPVLNDVSKDLALRPLQSLGIAENKFTKDDLNKCSPKYYVDVPTMPFSFRYAVPI